MIVLCFDCAFDCFYEERAESGSGKGSDATAHISGPRCVAEG